jgi:hypothetical protein
MICLQRNRIDHGYWLLLSAIPSKIDKPSLDGSLYQAEHPYKLSSALLQSSTAKCQLSKQKYNTSLLDVCLCSSQTMTQNGPLVCLNLPSTSLALLQTILLVHMSVASQNGNSRWRCVFLP